VRRPVLLLICLVALATGFAIGAGLMVVAPDHRTGPLGPPSASADTDAAVVGFYAAVNTALATGDSAPLTALLAPDFADRAADPGRAATREGLVRHVLALRAAFPDLRLVVEDVRADGDRVVAWVRAEGGDRGVLLGVPFAGIPPSWAGLDVFRVADGRVAERWAAGDEPVPPQTLVRVPLADLPAEADAWLARLTFAPGAHEPEAGERGPLVLAVEAGALTVTAFGSAVVAPLGGVASTGKDAKSLPEGAVVTLSPGDGLLLPPAAHYAVRNAERSPAVALALALLPSAGSPDAGAVHWPGAGSPDVVVQPLAGGLATGLPAGAAEVTLGRLTLAPGVTLAADGAVVPRLIAIESGTLQLATNPSPAVTLSAGQGSLIDSTAVPTLRNAGGGPLVVLLGTITPTGAATAWG
jgi:predicted ester cyclase